MLICYSNVKMPDWLQAMNPLGPAGMMHSVIPTTIPNS